MTSIADSSVSIQASCVSVPSTPSWFGEIALIVAHLRKQGTLTKISERVRFAQRRIGRYEVIDFLAVLFGQVVRTRTVISQAHTFQWLGSFGNRGNGLYRAELRQALAAIDRYLTTYQFPKKRALLRLDGQYGTGAVLSDLAGFAFVLRGKEYTVLDHHR